MNTTRQWLPKSRKSSLYWWLRVTLVAFVLSAWLTVSVAGGIARADSPPPSGGESNSEGSSGVRHAASPSDPATRSGLRNRPPRHLHSESRDRTTTDPSPRKSAANPDGPDGQTPVGAGSRVDTATADETTPGDEEPAAKRKQSEPQFRHSERRLGVTGVAAKPVQSVKPISADPQPPSASGATNFPRAVAHETQHAIQADDPKPMAASVTPADPPAPNRLLSPNTIDVPQLGRQAVGLVSDVGVVAASAVYTVANTFANAVGPDDFFGVPYAIATALANTAAAAGRTLIGAPLDAASQGRFAVNYGIIDGLTFVNPQQPPPGANNRRIDVTPEHPLPIILLNGTTATQGTNWAVGAPVLANAGYKVYTFNYGNITQDPNSPIQATADIRQSARELSAEVERVLTETGAEKVILIGHSQGGGILPVYYINNLGGDEKVSQLIGIAPSNHGTDFNGLVGLRNLPILGPLLFAAVDLLGPAFGQQLLGSSFQKEVYGHGDTRPGVLYTTIASTNDEIVTPYTQQALTGPNVTNIVLQDIYPGLPAGHLGVVLSPQVWSVVLDALASNPEANPLADPLDSLELAA
jgi:triacylglycerol esterase/lipase EstA (alpha/beta hydrolase family)